MRRKDWLAGAAGATGLVAAQRADAAMIGARRALLSGKATLFALYVANNGSSNVTAYSIASGNALFSYSVSGPQGVAVDSLGRVYVPTADGTVYIYAANGGPQITSFSAASGSGGIYLDMLGNMYIACYSSNAMNEYSPNGSLIQSISLSGVDNVTLDANSYIYLSSYLLNEVIKVPPRGGGAVLTLSVSGAAGVTVDPYGNIWCCSYINNSLIKFSSSGSNLLTVTGLSGSNGCVSDSAGNIYVANRSNNTVSVVNQTGSITRTFSVGSLPFQLALH